MGKFTLLIVVLFISLAFIYGGDVDRYEVKITTSRGEVLLSNADISKIKKGFRSSDYSINPESSKTHYWIKGEDVVKIEYLGKFMDDGTIKYSKEYSKYNDHVNK